MKKSLQLIAVLSLAILFGACSQNNPSVDPVGHTADMINLEKDLKNNIQDSVNKENERLNNTLNENNMENQNMLGDNSELVKKYSVAILKTSLGDIKIKLDAANAPITVGNFLKLAEAGFYNGVKFHRVIKNFMIQGGDPLSKDEANKNSWGTGGPGYKFSDELKGNEKYLQGTLAMANSGPDTNGSQFFIVTASPSVALPASYTVFGQVISGLDIALKIENVKTDSRDCPMENVIIKSIMPLEK
jgi:cyclophilin family peptidyl-prolyl cis-trans isomerase